MIVIISIIQLTIPTGKSITKPSVEIMPHTIKNTIKNIKSDVLYEHVVMYISYYSGYCCCIYSCQESNLLETWSLNSCIILDLVAGGTLWIVLVTMLHPESNRHITIRGIIDIAFIILLILLLEYISF